LAEESGGQPGEEENARWIVDPLDGTTNYAVSIALGRAR
jgi:fructose-1,6-bisphosphatase/inositol monophosphatase family enzyme